MLKNPLRFTHADGSDHYQSPSNALDALLPYLPKGKSIWECAKGDGNLLRILKEAGFKAKGTDIQQGHDFRKSKKPQGDIIVTTPPFRYMGEFLTKAYGYGIPFAFLMPLTAIEGKDRQRLYKKHGLELLIVADRIDFFTPTGKKSHAPFACAWYCHQLLPKALVFAISRYVETPWGKVASWD